MTLNAAVLSYTHSIALASGLSRARVRAARTLAVLAIVVLDDLRRVIAGADTAGSQAIEANGYDGHCHKVFHVRLHQILFTTTYEYLGASACALIWVKSLECCARMIRPCSKRPINKIIVGFALTI